METTTFLEYWFWASWIVLFVLIYKFVLKNIIKRKMYGDRWQYYHIIDTGDSGYVLFPSDYSSVKINGLSRVYNREKIVAGVMYYTQKNSEPLQIKCDFNCDNPNSVEWFCDSHEFTTVLHNSLIEKLFLSLESTNIQRWFMILCVISIGIIGLMWYKFNGMQTQLTEMETLINSLKPIQNEVITNVP